MSLYTMTARSYAGDGTAPLSNFPYSASQTVPAAPTYTAAPEDVQDIVTPLPLPSQLPVVKMPPTQYDGVSAPHVRTGRFALPPSAIQTNKFF